MRGLGRLVIVGAVVAVAVAVGRAGLGRTGGEPGVPSAGRGSFDSWPAVPPAPGRPLPNGATHEATNGSRVPAES